MGKGPGGTEGNEMVGRARKGGCGMRWDEVVGCGSEMG